MNLKAIQIFLTVFVFSYNLNAQVPTISEGYYTTEVPEPANGGFYSQNGKYGIITTDNKRLPLSYDLILHGINSYIAKKDGKFFILNKAGEKITDFYYDSINVLNGNYVVRNKNKFGLINPEFKEILSLKYAGIVATNNFISVIKTNKGDTSIVFNKTLKEFKQPIEYLDVLYNLAIIKSGGKFGVITNETVIPFIYDSIATEINFTDKKQNKNFKRINYSGIARIPFFDLITIKAGKYGLINIDGKEIFEPEYDKITRMNNRQFILAEKNKKFSVYFTSEKIKVADEFERVYSGSQALIIAVKNNRSGALNFKGEEVVPFLYDAGGINVLSKYIIVSRNGKKGLLNFKGEVLIQPEYDEINSFYESGFDNFFQIRLNNKYGVSTSNGIILQPEFIYVDADDNYFTVVTTDSLIGIADKTGNFILQPKYKYVHKSDTKNSIFKILKDSAGIYLFNLINKSIFPKTFVHYGYVLDDENLYNPLNKNKHYLLLLKDVNGKFGMMNEITGENDIPFEYENIYQRFSDSKHTYFAAKKNGKSGLINELNKEVIPFIYDTLDLDFADGYGSQNRIVASLKGKYGVINLDNEVLIPFKYIFLKSVSGTGIFKAKLKNDYAIITAKNKMLTDKTFDEVANFERDNYEEEKSEKTLVFKGGRMQILKSNGEMINETEEMSPHIGFKTFGDLKEALIAALNSSNDSLLKVFAVKISPSSHILYYLKHNVLNGKDIASISIENIREKYFNDLKLFKERYWKQPIAFDKRSLTEIPDYTIHKSGIVTNARNNDHAFGNTKYLEKILRNSIKINGFWISTYFMRIRN